jgi:hypothetical protein
MLVAMVYNEVWCPGYHYCVQFQNLASLNRTTCVA